MESLPPSPLTRSTAAALPIVIVSIPSPPLTDPAVAAVAAVTAPLTVIASSPALPLIIEENYTKELTKKLVQGELDVIIVAEPYAQQGVKTVPLFTESLFVIMPPNHAWSKKSTITPADLHEEQVLLLGQGHCFRDDVLRACPDCGINNRANTAEEKMVEGSSLETIRHMVASGMGISVLPESAINAEQYADDYFIVKPFKKPTPTRNIVLAYRQAYPRTQIIELLQQQFS